MFLSILSMYLFSNYFLTILAGCKREFKNREQFHPKIYTLPPLTQEQSHEIKKLPLNFDWCEEGMCAPSVNQHIPQYCGSCFAHGSLAAATDRIKIMNKKRGYKGPDVMLGRQSFLNCAPGHGLSQGCDGGRILHLLEFSIY